MLTEAQVAELNDRGYVVPYYRLPQAELEDVRARYARLLEPIRSSATTPRFC